jgi:hypothetical protein
MLSALNFGIESPGYDGGASVTSDAVQAAGFYNKTNLLHSAGFELNNFVGTIGIQATLVSNPQESDWSNVIETFQTYAVPYTGNYLQNFEGNYVWVRTSIANFTGGTIIRTVLNI